MCIDVYWSSGHSAQDIESVLAKVRAEQPNLKFEQRGELPAVDGPIDKENGQDLERIYNAVIEESAYIGDDRISLVLTTFEIHRTESQVQAMGFSNSCVAVVCSRPPVSPDQRSLVVANSIIHELPHIARERYAPLTGLDEWKHCNHKDCVLRSSQAETTEQCMRNILSRSFHPTAECLTAWTEALANEFG